VDRGQRLSTLAAYLATLRPVRCQLLELLPELLPVELLPLELLLAELLPPELLPPELLPLEPLPLEPLAAEPLPVVLLGAAARGGGRGAARAGIHDRLPAR